VHTFRCVDYIRIITFRPLPPWPRESPVFGTLQVMGPALPCTTHFYSLPHSLPPFYCISAGFSSHPHRQSNQHHPSSNSNPCHPPSSTAYSPSSSVFSLSTSSWAVASIVCGDLSGPLLKQLSVLCRYGATQAAVCLWAVVQEAVCLWAVGQEEVCLWVVRYP
jgi:hypothetical protein